MVENFIRDQLRFGGARREGSWVLSKVFFGVIREDFRFEIRVKKGFDGRKDHVCG